MKKINMLPTRKVKFNLLINLLFLLVAITIFGSGLWFISNLQAKTAVQKVELQTEQNFSDSLADIKKTLQESQGEVLTFNQYFLGSNDTITYLDTLESIAIDNGIDLTLSVSQTLEPLEDESLKLAFLSIVIATEGSLSDTVSFYRDLSLLDPMTTMDGLTLSNQSAKNQVANSRFVDLEESDDTSSSDDNWQSQATIKVLQQT